MKRFEIFFGIIKIPVDLVMTILGFFFAYQLRLITEPIPGIAKPIDYTVLPTLNEYLKFSSLAAAILIIIFIFGKIYSLRATYRFSQEINKTAILCGIWIMAMITYFFFTRTFPFSRLAIFYSWILTLFFIILGRTLIKFIQFILLKKGIGRRRLAIIGNNSITKEIYNYLEHNIHYKILGLIANDNENTIKHLGPISNFPEILKRIKPDEVIQTKSDLTETQNEDILEFCELNHINYRFIPDLLDVRRTNIEIETISGIPIISLKPTPLDGWGKVYKRTVDIIGSTLGMIILSPVLLLTAIAIKIDSRGPVLFSKLDNDTPAVRVGQHGRLFKFYKFRSMHHNTHDLRAKLADNNLRSDGPLMKIKNDPRITRVGKFLRRSSIDELPQLWNIFLGNMSLVGPRPHLPEEVEKYQQHHRFVLTIKPGLSGLPQISGRSGLSFEEEVKLDRFYIENWSIWLDIKIILKTLYIVLRGYQE